MAEVQGSGGYRLLDDRWPDRFAAVFLLYAAFTVVVTTVPPWRRFFSHQNDAISMLTIPVAPGLGYAALLVVMAVALRRRLRAAWLLMLVWWLIVPQIFRVVTFVTGAPLIELVLQGVGFVLMLVVIVITVRVRDQFRARRVPGSLRAAIAVFVIGAIVTIATGTLLTDRFGRTSSTLHAASHALNTLLGDLGRVTPSDAVLVPWLVRLIVGLLGAVTVLVPAQLLFRPPRTMLSLDAGDEARIRTLLRDFGDHDSLGYFATRRDKAVVWDTGTASTTRAGVSCRAVGSISLASGNPVGDPVHWPAAIEAWREQARAAGLSLAVMGAGEAAATAYATAGLSAYEIGDEAIVDLRTFSLSGPGMKAVRQPVSRLQRRGYAIRVLRHRELGAADFELLSIEAAAWRGDGGDERGFSMSLGRLGDPLDGDCVMVQAHDGDGRLRGFLSLVPWGRNGLSLDLMRRDPTADNPEARVRARYVDLIIRPAAREVAQARSTVVRSVRDSLHRRGFTEVETPILQLIHGGANARPFETHINAYDLDLYLRIATELHLKRLVVGGLESDRQDEPDENDRDADHLEGSDVQIADDQVQHDIGEQQPGDEHRGEVERTGELREQQRDAHQQGREDPDHRIGDRVVGGEVEVDRDETDEGQHDPEQHEPEPHDFHPSRRRGVLSSPRPPRRRAARSPRAAG